MATKKRGRSEDDDEPTITVAETKKKQKLEEDSEEDNDESTMTPSTSESAADSDGSQSEEAAVKAPTEITFNNIEESIEQGWREQLKGEFQKAYFKNLKKFLVADEKEHTIYPPKEHIFNAFNHCRFDNVKVVIIGQDPYFNANQAHGLAFSVGKGVKVPPSLKNIYKELKADIPSFKEPNHGFLESWADQGVLMLNVVLTVRAGTANSHQRKGWEQFTDAVMQILNTKKSGLVFMLWGAPAQKKGAGISSTKHLVLKAAHPSPLARNAFSGCRHFSKCNTYLESKGKTPINWSSIADF